MSPDSTQIFERILECLGAKNAPDVARKLGLSKQAVYDWQKNVPGLENLIKIAKSGNTSLDWLLTGEHYPSEKTRVQKGIIDPILNREALKDLIREVMQDEIAQNVQDLGVIDEFDVASAVKKYDNALPVLRDWYAHDNIPMPTINVDISFHGWADMTFEQKVRHVRYVRKSIQEDLSFRAQRDAQLPKTPRTVKKKV